MHYFPTSLCGVLAFRSASARLRRVRRLFRHAYVNNSHTHSSHTSYTHTSYLSYTPPTHLYILTSHLSYSHLTHASHTQTSHLSSLILTRASIGEGCARLVAVDRGACCHSHS